jgi:phosphatidylserine decarboxylase
MTIAREGFPLIGGFLAAAAVFFFLNLTWLGLLCSGLGIFTAFFFRDPERSPPQGSGVIISPADGRVVRVAPAPPTNPVGEGAQQVSIFMSVFNVHVNRAPMSGRIIAVDHRKGEFLPAFDEAASFRNEQNEVVVEADEGGRMAFTQIAGLIARRIVFRGAVGETLERGARVGLIQFGSRVDVVLPIHAQPRVTVGQRVRAGVSVIGEMPCAERAITERPA